MQKNNVKKNRKKAVLSKTGLPLLSDEDDLIEAFTGESVSKTGFEELVEKSFSDNRFREFLKEKTASEQTRQRISDIIKKYPPQEEIDLHGRTAWEAEEETRAFLRQSAGAGVKAVKIIAGKGLHSDGKPVIKDVVEKIVVELKRNKTVLTFIWEKGVKAHSGAVIVYLS